MSLATSVKSYAKNEPLGIAKKKAVMNAVNEQNIETPGATMVVLKELQSAIGFIIEPMQEYAAGRLHWIFEYIFNGKLAVFDDAVINLELSDISLTEPYILNHVKEMLRSMIIESNPHFTQDTITIHN